MRISHKYKFIYFAPAKTGSTTIRNTLNQYSDIISQSHQQPYAYHQSPLPLQRHFLQKKWEWDAYLKFVTVRNPWDRMVSLWGYGIKETGPLNKTHGFVNGMMSFKEWISSDSDFIRLVGNYTRYYIGKNNEVNVDYFIKLENLQEDFNIICDKIGIPRQELPHNNKSKHKHYTEYYDDETREIVAEKYAKDIEHFGYGYGE